MAEIVKWWLLLCTFRPDSDGNVVADVEITSPTYDGTLPSLNEALENAVASECTNCISDNLLSITEDVDASITDTTPNSKKEPICNYVSVWIFTVSSNRYHLCKWSMTIKVSTDGLKWLLLSANLYFT